MKKKSISDMKKAKIVKLKERLEAMQKSQQFIMHKLEHFVSTFEEKISSMDTLNSILRKELD